MWAYVKYHRTSRSRCKAFGSNECILRPESNRYEHFGIEHAQIAVKLYHHDLAAEAKD